MAADRQAPRQEMTWGAGRAPVVDGPLQDEGGHVGGRREAGQDGDHEQHGSHVGRLQRGQGGIAPLHHLSRQAKSFLVQPAWLLSWHDQASVGDSESSVHRQHGLLIAPEMLSKSTHLSRLTT